MKAVLLKGIGDVSNLVIEEVPQPEITENEILIKAQAASINPIEVKTRKGNRFSEKLLVDKPSILGWDGSGIVEKVGENIKNFKKGDRVFGVIGFPEFGKTYAEFFKAREHHLVKIPENIGFAEAATATIAAITAYQALTYDAELAPGKKVLIHAASGGVGHFGVQISKHLGAEIYATASPEKHAFVKALGADHLIDYRSQKFEEVVKGVDVVFDLIGGEYIDRSLHCLKKGGVIISIPSATNEGVEKKATEKGFVGIRFIMNANKTDQQHVADLLEKGVLKPHISHQFPLEKVREAHQELEKGHVTGKIALTMN